MEFVKFNRVAPIVVDTPESIRTDSNYLKIALEQFDTIDTYSKIGPDIRVLDFSDAFISEAQEYDLYERSAFKQGIELGYFANITEVVCTNIESYEDGSYEAEYQDYVINTIKDLCDFPNLIKLTLDGLPSSYIDDVSHILKRKPHIYVSLLDIDVQAEHEAGFGLQDVVEIVERSIVTMEAAGVRLNVSCKVHDDEDDDEDAILCTPSTWESVPALKRLRDDDSDDEPAAKR